MNKTGKIRRRETGFTLMELVIAMCVMGILFGVAVPNYSSFVRKSRISGAQDDIINLSASIEASMLQNPANVVYPAGPFNGVAAIQQQFSSWVPSDVSEKYFGYSYRLDTVPNPDQYVLTATGKSADKLSGCNVILRSNNQRTLTTSCIPGGTTTW